MPGKKNVPAEPVRIRIRKNDMVRVISGRDKGKTGRVLEVNRKTGRLLVEGVMLVKRHTRPNPQKQIKGGIAEKEASIHASNVMVLTSGGIPTRIGTKLVEGGRRVRVARKTGEELK
jgi:large subunit ribosomal protein L24